MVRPRADGGTGLFDGLLNAQSPYSLDPFADNLSSSSDDDSSSEVEEIDAQEVYGMPAFTTFQACPSSSRLTHPPQI